MPPRKQGGKVCPADHKHATNATCYTAHQCRCTPCRERGNAYSRWARATPSDRMARTHVNAIGTRRRMQALMALGYSPAEMARRLGMHHQLVWRWAKQDTVTRLTAARIRGLYDELTRLPAPNPTDRYLRSAATKTRRMAERAGWVTPDAWWDVDIDDPGAEADTTVEPDSAGWVVNELDHLHALGESPAQAAMQLHGDRASLARLARRHRRPDLAVWLGEKAKKAA